MTTQPTDPFTPESVQALADRLRAFAGEFEMEMPSPGHGLMNQASDYLYQCAMRLSETPTMTKRYVTTELEKLNDIRAWYDRHRHDYDPADQTAPPKVWSEFFQWLLDHVVLREDGNLPCK